MKNKRFKFLLVFFASIFINTTLQSDELEINSNKIRYDDLNKVTILEWNVDATDNQMRGGSGTTFDWNILKDLNCEKLFIAGGLKPDNILDLLSR